MHEFVNSHCELFWLNRQTAYIWKLDVAGDSRFARHFVDHAHDRHHLLGVGGQEGHTE